MNTCPYDPMEMAGQPIGMFHCEFCGEMVVAGLPHPDYSTLDDLTEEDFVGAPVADDPE